ncbi:hypothetical protein EMIT0111MI5_11160 [Burkholderia sp. IT-111MI5]
MAGMKKQLAGMKNDAVGLDP